MAAPTEDDDVDDRFEFVSEEDRRAFKAFCDDLTPDQQRRYESFRRSGQSSACKKTY